MAVGFMRRTLLTVMTIGAILCGESELAAARGPADSLADDQLLQEAVADIARMDRAELEQFTDVVAQCWNRPEGVQGAPSCDGTFRAYRMQWRDGRAVDLLTLAWWIVASVRPKSGASEPNWQRWLDVGEALERAANARYKTLRSSR